MPDLTVIVPSRSRPDAAAELIETFRQTCTADTHLLFAVDDNDPALDAYRLCRSDWVDVVVVDGEPKNMVHALNQAAAEVVHSDPFAVGFMGDDHRPRTRGWDGEYVDALRRMGTGFTFGDDLLQGSRLPTQIAMTTDIIRELGYMSPPSLAHLAVDNYWLALGTRADCISFLPQVVVEHMHPVAGKAKWDEGYERVNSPDMYSHDLAEFKRIELEDLPRDVAKVRALRTAAA